MAAGRTGKMADDTDVHVIKGSETSFLGSVWYGTSRYFLIPFVQVRCRRFRV